MRFLVVAVGSHGDIHPLLGIAIALRDRGHDVTFVSSPYFEDLPRKAGLDFAPLGTVEQFRDGLKDPDLWHPRKGFKAVFQRGVLPVMRPTYEALAGRVEPGRTVIVAHSIAFGARVARDKLGVPLVTTQLQPAVFRTVHETPKLPGFPVGPGTPRWAKRLCWWLADHVMVEPVLRGPVNAFLRELGLPPAKGILDRWWMSPDLVLGLFPEWFAAPQPDWPSQTKLTGFPLYDERGLEPLPADLARFLDDGPPPVAFTPGSAMLHGADFFAQSAEACRQLGRRGVLLTRHAEQVPRDLPPGVRHFAYVPFSQLLPRCAALVHHGGIGTMAQALAAGCPQLIMPLSHDQFDNADRVKRLGVGDEIAVRDYQAPRVAERLARLTPNDAVERACRAIAARFPGTDGIALACDAIESLARHRLGDAASQPMAAGV